MTLRWLILCALCACGLVAAPAEARTPSRAAFELSNAGKKALKSRSISLPRSSSFAVGDLTIGSTAKIGQSGSLRFTAGRRKVGATRLTVTISRTSSYVTARLGGKTVRLFTVAPTKPAVLDAAQQRASLSGARVALTKASARRLKSLLKLRRAPSRATIGKLTVGVAAELTQPPAAPAPVTPTQLPAPAPIVTPEPTAIATATATPSATATPVATVTPGPDLPCDSTRFTATPADVLDWFGCDLPGSQDLKSWTSYIQTPFPPVPCAGSTGTITPGGGASEVVAGDRNDHRFPILSSAISEDGSATIVTSGDVSYRMPVHGIDEAIGTFKIVIDAGGKTGTVFAGGRYKPFDTGGDSCTSAPLTYAEYPVLNLDLSAITPVSADGVKRWVHVPATIAAEAGERIGGGNYGAGRPWGSFTIAVPEP
jgi:hypothetical protein